MAFTSWPARSAAGGRAVLTLAEQGSIEGEIQAPVVVINGRMVGDVHALERIEQVAKIASGYVYYVSLAGVTGSGALNVDAVAERLPAIREKTGLPVGVGFGIRDASTAARIAGFADAVVVCSRIIEEIEKSTAETACANVKALVSAIRSGVDEVKQ